MARRVALVTGGGRGIGRAIVLELARNGCDVAVNYAKSADAADETARAASALGVRAETFGADVSDRAQAEALFKAGKLRGIPMKRVAQAPFFVLRGAGMPAVLLETGFVTNATEAKLLAHPGYQERIAEAMATGVARYLR